MVSNHAHISSNDDSNQKKHKKKPYFWRAVEKLALKVPGAQRWYRHQIKIQKLQAILDTTVDGLITMDDRCIVESYNKACEQIFGYSESEVIGKNIKMLMPEHIAMHHDGYVAEYINTGQKHIIGRGRELEAQRKDGTLVPIYLAVSEFWVGSQCFFSGIVRDISEIKAIENSLRSANHELEHFAFVASHDLKAPLRGIHNLAQWTKEDIDNKDYDKVGENMVLIQTRIDKFRNMLDGILSYSMAGKITENPKEIHVQELLSTCVDVLGLNGAICQGENGGDDVLAPTKSSAGKSCIFIQGDDLQIFSAVTPLEQVINNLVTNAIKHHDKEHYRIHIQWKDLGQFVEFRVIDDGPGIPDESKDNVFKIFHTLKAIKNTESSGLGMAMVKKLVEWQGGQVRIENNDNQPGCAVIFTWPKMAKQFG